MSGPTAPGPFEWLEDVQRRPQETIPTIFGCKRAILRNCQFSYRKIEVFEGRRVGLGVQNRPQEAPKGDKKRYRKKKIENRRKEDHQERQTKPKRVPRRIWRPSLVDLEAPKSSQEPPKSSQKEPERAPKRFQNHLWIENVDFSKMLRFTQENQCF